MPLMSSLMLPLDKRPIRISAANVAASMMPRCAAALVRRSMHHAGTALSTNSAGRGFGSNRPRRLSSAETSAVGMPVRCEILLGFEPRRNCVTILSETSRDMLFGFIIHQQIKCGGHPGHAFTRHLHEPRSGPFRLGAAASALPLMRHGPIPESYSPPRINALHASSKEMPNFDIRSETFDFVTTLALRLPSAEGRFEPSAFAAVGG